MAKEVKISEETLEGIAKMLDLLLGRFDLEFAMGDYDNADNYDEALLLLDSIINFLPSSKRKKKEYTCKK